MELMDAQQDGYRSRFIWLRAVRTYFAVIVVGNLVWESLQLPLYTIWTTGSPGEKAFAVAHCTAGDVLIAASALASAWLVAGARKRLSQGYAGVASLAISLGLGYTGFSEWLNVSVRQSWAYSPWMPVIPLGGGIGLSPLLQWLFIPWLAFWVVMRRSVDPSGSDVTSS
jgi:hypothetical protein